MWETEPYRIYKTAENRKARSQTVLNLMETVGLSRNLAGAYPHELDGGRRQRIGIARALALDPKFIVCDEPISALDVSVQAQILNLMQDLQQERALTYLFITHNLSVDKHISTNIMVMYLGKVMEFSPGEELFEHPTHPYTQALLSAIPVPDIDVQRQRILLKGEIYSPIEPKPGYRFAPRCVHAKEICSREEPPTVEVSPGHMVACHLAGQLSQAFSLFYPHKRKGPGVFSRAFSPFSLFIFRNGSHSIPFPRRHVKYL